MDGLWPYYTRSVNSKTFMCTQIRHHQLLIDSVIIKQLSDIWLWQSRYMQCWMSACGQLTRASNILEWIASSITPPPRTMKGNFEFRFATFHEQLVVEKIIHSQCNLTVSYIYLLEVNFLTTGTAGKLCLFLDTMWVCNQYINKLQYNKILVSSQKSFSTILERIDREYNNI